ncbi:MAG: LLM class F420-dependent oxidoreductase [Acidimicrobiales bacterium]|jgi:F420-dependent oxidoreductase-like protein|nr:LLM class F420-dependent oxidoreductase [Acidimicrobiales bacterium]
MRFAIKTAPQHTTWEDLLAVWRAADTIPVFESAWNFDHFYPIFSDPTGPCLEGWVTLTALAQATTRLRIGTMVNGVPYRHPALVANMAAALDIVSGGRLELGLGAGWNEEEAGAYGIDLLPTWTERFDRLEEALEVITGLLSRETTTFEGRYYRLTDARCEPKPVQRPHPPICIGGNGEKRTLRAVARYADHWNFIGGPPEDLRRKLDVLGAHCAAVGRDRSEIRVSAQLMSDLSDLGRLAHEANQLGEAGADLVIVYLPPPHRVAVLEPLAEALAAVG